MEYLPIALFVVGFFLILVEIFLPAFGVFGITGAICILIGIYFLEDNLAMAIFEMSIVIIMLALGIPLLIKVINRRKVLASLGLYQTLTNEEGFSSRKKGLEQYIGEKGKAITDLRPSGTIVLDDDTRLDVVTRGDYITKQNQVEIVGIDGTWLVVRSVK